MKLGKKLMSVLTFISLLRSDVTWTGSVKEKNYPDRFFSVVWLKDTCMLTKSIETRLSELAAAGLTFVVFSYTM